VWWNTQRRHHAWLGPDGGSCDARVLAVTNFSGLRPPTAHAIAVCSCLYFEVLKSIKSHWVMFEVEKSG
jgi:hypothetical protein